MFLILVVRAALIPTRSLNYKFVYETKYSYIVLMHDVKQHVSHCTQVRQLLFCPCDPFKYWCCTIIARLGCMFLLLLVWIIMWACSDQHWFGRLWLKAQTELEFSQLLWKQNLSNYILCMLWWQPPMTKMAVIYIFSFSVSFDPIDFNLCLEWLHTRHDCARHRLLLYMPK